jgi:hypothetical protein
MGVLVMWHTGSEDNGIGYVQQNVPAVGDHVKLAEGDDDGEFGFYEVVGRVFHQPEPDSQRVDIYARRVADRSWEIAALAFAAPSVAMPRKGGA